MSSANDKSGKAADSGAREKSHSVLEAILSNADPASWYPDAPKVRSAWEPFDLCDLRGSILSNRRIGKVMMAECALDDADFTSALLEKTSLQSTSASRAKFVDASLYQTQMIPFYGEAIDFSRAKLKQAFMSHSKLPNCFFISTVLDDVSMSHADVSQSSFVGAQFTASRLDQAVLRDADLSQTVFSACDLRMTVFQNAQMKGTLLEDCEMLGTDFRGADLDRAVIRGGKFGVYQQGDTLTRVRFDDSQESRRLVAESKADGLESIEWSAAGSIPESLPKRLMPGDLCTRNGFWFTPAQAGSRSYFKSGDVMPNAGGDYGAALWQWDSNQNPPKL
jgi:uncharacterized protein YjbI with pentapeptide repeats